MRRLVILPPSAPCGAACGVHHQKQRLGQGEHRHGQRDEGKARLQFHHPKGEARHVGQRAFAHGAHHQAQDRHHQRLADLPGARKGRDGRQAHNHQREILGRMEQQRHGRQRGRKDHQQDRADRAAGESWRSPRWSAPCPPGLCGPSDSRRNEVATVPATPGAFSRIDEVEPPKIAP